MGKFWVKSVARWLSGMAITAGFFALLHLSLPVVEGQPREPAPIKVAARVISPFVMEEGGKLSGFGIDLWRSLAVEMGVESQFIPMDSVPKVLAAVEQKQADVGIANISITAEREQKFDFSYPMFSAGLQVMVRTANQSTEGPNLLNIIFSPTIRRFLGIALLMIIIGSHVVWLFERKRRESMVSKSYFPGIFEAAWWAAATLATQADQMPKGALSRVLAVFWMFVAVVFVALFTAAVTAELTVNRLQSDIRGIEDLSGRVVATSAGSTAAEYLQRHKFKAREFSSIEQAYDALINQTVDAVVFDAPVLMYFAAHEGKDQVKLVGDIFQEEKYGIVMPYRSPYRKSINQALLTLVENGTYQTLYNQYFKAQSETLR
jgi:polar amino acid transport system substrate-binding protein